MHFSPRPVWRFWLGADISGATVIGAIMPSVDGVGRYYPLTLLAVADPAHSIPPPDLNAQDQWFAAAEEFLLSTLDQAKSFDDISTALDAMPAPLMEATISSSNEVLAIGDTMVGIITAGKTFQDSLLMLRQSNHGFFGGRELSGGRKAAETSRRWRCARVECRIRSAIRAC